MKKYICHCGNTLTEGIQPDPKPDGTILGYPIWECDKCGDVFDEEDLKKENIQCLESEIFARDCDEDDTTLRERIKKVGENPHIIKFKACNGIYELNLLISSLNYNGVVDNDVLKISGTTKAIADSHFQEKIDKYLVEDLKNEIKEQIQKLGYKFEFMEG